MRARPGVWSPKLLKTHRPITICEHCREQWPCAEERESRARQERMVELAKAIGGKR